MIDAVSFINVQLRGGFVIEDIKFTRGPLKDALGREAIAQTTIVGRKFHLLIRSDLDDDELSVTLYHEILEAASVADSNPPASVMDFNEGDFERVAREMHKALGKVTPGNLNRMLQFHGFRGE